MEIDSVSFYMLRVCLQHDELCLLLFDFTCTAVPSLYFASSCPKKKGIVEAHESTRRRLESTLPRSHEDHIAEKGSSSISHYNLYASSDEHSECESRSGQNMGEAREVASVERVKSKKEVILEARKRETESPLCHIDGHLSSQGCGVIQYTRNIEDESCSEVTL